MEMKLLVLLLVALVGVALGGSLRSEVADKLKYSSYYGNGYNNDYGHGKNDWWWWWWRHPVPAPVSSPVPAPVPAPVQPPVVIQPPVVPEPEPPVVPEPEPPVVPEPEPPVVPEPEPPVVPEPEPPVVPEPEPPVVPEPEPPVVPEPEPPVVPEPEPPVVPEPEPPGEEEPEPPIETPITGSATVLGGATLSWSQIGDQIFWTLAAEGTEGWLGVGQGTQMVGSKVVIGTNEGVGEYSLTQKSPAGVNPVADSNAIIDASFVQENGKLVLTFTAPTSLISLDQSMVVAKGPNNAIGYHGFGPENRQVIADIKAIKNT